MYRSHVDMNQGRKTRNTPLLADRYFSAVNFANSLRIAKKKNVDVSFIDSNKLGRYVQEIHRSEGAKQGHPAEHSSNIVTPKKKFSKLIGTYNIKKLRRTKSVVH